MPLKVLSRDSKRTTKTAKRFSCPYMSRFNTFKVAQYSFSLIFFGISLVCSNPPVPILTGIPVTVSYVVCPLPRCYQSRPSCSKLTMSLVNDTLNFKRIIRKNHCHFCGKIVRNFCSSLHFSCKNMSIPLIVYVLEDVTNPLTDDFFKLTMLLTLVHWIIVGQRSTDLAVGEARDVFGYSFSRLSFLFFFLSP